MASKQTKTKTKSTEKKLTGAALRQKNLAPEKLTLLVTIVNREKTEYFLDVIQSLCSSNMQLSTYGVGTAQKALGLLTPDAEKAVIFSVINKQNAKAALQTLEEKFSAIRGGKGVAFTVPITCTIGVLIYRFLSNKE